MQPNCVDREVLNAGWQRTKIDETWNIQKLTYLSETKISLATDKYCGHLRA